MTGPFPDQPGARPGQPGQPGANPGQPAQSQPAFAGGFAPPQPPPPMVVERGPRPIVVTAAGMLLFAQAVITLLSFLLLLANQDEVISAAVRQADESDSSGQNVESFVKFSVYAVGGCSLLMAAVVAVFAMLVLRGKNWARITTAILAGLFAVLGLFGVISSAVQPMEGVAGWYTACSLILTTASTLCLGASAVMLLLPATNDWFSKR